MYIEYSLEFAAGQGVVSARGAIANVTDQDQQNLAIRIGNIWLKYAKKEAPRRSHILPQKGQEDRWKKPGTLAKSLKLSPLFKDAAGYWQVTIIEDESTRTDWNGVTVGQLVQYGTAPHIIRPRAGNPFGQLFFHREAPYQRLPKNRPPGRAGRGLLLVQSGKKGYRRFLAPARGTGGGVLPAIRSGRVSRRAGDNTLVVANSVMHPGTAPNPFIERARQLAGPEIEREIANFNQRINRRLGIR